MFLKITKYNKFVRIMDILLTSFSKNRGVHLRDGKVRSENPRVMNQYHPRYYIIVYSM